MQQDGAGTTFGGQFYWRLRNTFLEFQYADDAPRGLLEAGGPGGRPARSQSVDSGLATLREAHHCLPTNKKASTSSHESASASTHDDLVVWCAETVDSENECTDTESDKDSQRGQGQPNYLMTLCSGAEWLRGEVASPAVKTVRGGAARLDLPGDSLDEIATSDGLLMADMSPADSEQRNDEDDEEGVTTVMLRNIACRYSQEEVAAMLDNSGLRGTYNFVYIPQSPSRARTSNLGYAFINFKKAVHVRECHRLLHGKPLGHSQSQKLCEVVPAHVQGRLPFTARLRKGGRKDKASPLFVGDGSGAICLADCCEGMEQLAQQWSQGPPMAAAASEPPAFAQRRSRQDTRHVAKRRY